MPGIENQMIARLPHGERLRLLAVCEPVELVLADVLCESAEPTRYAYFPIEGFISLVAEIDGHPGLEVGMVGREGMLGAHLALGVAITPLRAVVQGSGSAWRIGAADFRQEIAGSDGLRNELHRYLYTMLLAMTTASACMRFHRIGARLARWFLMSQDRAHSKQFMVTHEFLAYMLGVRRVGITVAAGDLQRHGLVEYRRGHVTVLDRRGLEAMACSCYEADRRSRRKWGRS